MGVICYQEVEIGVIYWLKVEMGVICYQEVKVKVLCNILTRSWNEVIY